MPGVNDGIQYLKGIGPVRAKLFEALGIRTIGDLMYHYPRSYEDRTRFLPISKLEVDQPSCFKAMVMNHPRTSFIRKGLEITRVTVADHSARLNLTFFNQRFMAEKLRYGETYIFYGAVSGDFIGYNMQNPVVESPQEAPLMTRRILPLYPLTAGLSNKAVTSAIIQALETCGAPPEILPRQIRQQHQILPAELAYRAIHQPQSQEQLAQARKRLVFEEFFVFSAALSLMRASRAAQPVTPWQDTDLTPFYSALPFTLTGAQTRAIEEIRADFLRNIPMNRLLQGDVGSGKTMVAAAAAYCAAKNGVQTALMAPTEILAEQHARSLGKLLEPLGVRCALLTGSMPAAKKRQVRAALADGSALLVIGTHALLSKTTEFANLGLVITDEQHRFGVAQRGSLSEKGHNVHTLVMSATPIPRTLALILYGDLEVSVLDELPPGRQKIDTFLVDETYRGRLNGFIRREVEAGHQCFIVCPAVEEGETGKSAEVWAQTLQQVTFPDLKVSLLHGRKSGAEKEAVMAAFARGASQILVATTVIEVGVDVPNATLMVVEDADRFGLSQLHQLRGRVGRGSAKSWCILLSNNRNPDTRSRLKALCRNTDGFRIAEEDLQLRDPGDFFGRRQHGLPTFRAANLSMDLSLLKEAQAAAAQWIDQHGHEDTPEAEALRRRIAALFEDTGVVLN